MHIEHSKNFHDIEGTVTAPGHTITVCYLEINMQTSWLNGHCTKVPGSMCNREVIPMPLVTATEASTGLHLEINVNETFLRRGQNYPKNKNDQY